jgi:hypothetical protein
VEYGLAVVVLIVLVAVVVAIPLRNAGRHEQREQGRREELEAARDAKYREIRDTELDFRMGKLSETEYRQADRELRGEAIEILRRLDEVPGRGR